MLALQLCDFQGIRTSIAKEPYIFMIFQGGSVPRPPLWIRPWFEKGLEAYFFQRVILADKDIKRKRLGVGFGDTVVALWFNIVTIMTL